MSALSKQQIISDCNEFTEEINTIKDELENLWQSLYNLNASGAILDKISDVQFYGNFSRLQSKLDAFLTCICAYFEDMPDDEAEIKRRLYNAEYKLDSIKYIVDKDIKNL